MPAETSIPCSKRARDLVKAAKEERGDAVSYDEFLRREFGDGSATKV
jgi:hypothetical protein